MNQYSTKSNKREDTRVFAYGSSKTLQIVGKFAKIDVADIYVIKGNYGCLLGYETCVQLAIINKVATVTEDKIETLCNKFPTVFTGIGKLKNTQIRLHVDESVKPVSQPHRRIPFHVRKQVEKELEKLEKLDIIEKVNGPTPWVSPIVVAPKPKKPGEIRLCVDMRRANTAIQRERHVTPTIDDMILDLNGSKVLSKLDLNAEYHQLELHPDSRNITTFSTHVGLRRYKRLNFGISSAAEVFQNTLSTALERLQGVRNISDDIIAFGQNREEHDKNLEKVFKRLAEKNLTLNKEKCEFNKTQIEFYAYVFSSEGISADPRKVEAIKESDVPANASEVRSFLGMTNYVGRFIKNYSTITAPLRELTKQNVKFVWNSDRQKAFDLLKRELTSDKVMSYFDPTKETTMIVDASPVGLGALLTQEGRVISYGSRALNDVETRYSQTEREALAVIWGCEHFHLYLFGQEFTIISDHKPLETIFNNPNSKPPARIERWRLKLQPYHYRVQYRPGKSNTADYSVGNRRFLGVLNLGKLGPYGLGQGVCVQEELTIRCREGQDWGPRKGLLKNVKGGLLLLPPDERFLPGQSIERKCQLSITSYKASMVVGKTQKPINIFSRVGSRLVPEGLHIGISHFHSLGADLAFQELHSPLEQRELLWLKLDKHTS